MFAVERLQPCLDKRLPRFAITIPQIVDRKDHNTVLAETSSQPQAMSDTPQVASLFANRMDQPQEKWRRPHRSAGGGCMVLIAAQGVGGRRARGDTPN